MGLFKLKNPYPKMGITATSRKGKVNPNSEGNTDLKDGRSKSSTFQNKGSMAKSFLGALTGASKGKGGKSLFGASLGRFF